MAQVIIVSNRLPISVKKENAELIFSPSIGGLATGLSDYVNDPGNSWIGWPGIPSDDLTEQEKQFIAAELLKHNCYPVFLTKKLIDEYYNGYSNSILWPLFHNLPTQQINPDSINAWWSAYRKVNERFAETVVNLALTKSQIWIHDYHLLLLPEMLRSEHSVANIGFFLHIPFPNINTLSQLSEAKKLVHGMLGADLVGFHTTEYVHNFINYSEKMKVGTVTDNQIDLPSRTVRVAEFPMGIDYKKYADAGKSKEVKLTVKRFKKRYGRRKLIVSVDRLDPTKGLVNRLVAFRLFLERNPRQHGKIVFVMVAAPSRTEIVTYKQLGKRLGELAKEINQTFGNDNWQPVDYVNVTYSFEEVASLFHIADVAFITPLRDGMNLASKEFVATSKRSGALILSETAGAAEELSDALIVDPSHSESLVEALQQALTMKKRELRGRLSRMKKKLSVNNVQDWAKTFVDTLQQPLPNPSRWTRTINKTLIENIFSDFQQAKKRLILLDYDGTLVPFSTDYRKAKPPKTLIQLLEKLSANYANDIVLISGRSASDLQEWFGATRMSLVAEHGAAIKKEGNKTWQTVDKATSDWKQLIQPVLEKYTKLTPGARVEVKQQSLVWHYRAATPYHAQKYAVVIKRSLKPILKTYGLELLQGNKILEIKDPKISKANAARHWLDHNYSFVLSIGDDLTDEALFLALGDSNYSIKVGRGRTSARFRVVSSKDAVSLLQRLAG